MQSARLLMLTLLLSACASVERPSNPVKPHRLIEKAKQTQIAPELLRLDIEQLVEVIQAVHPDAFQNISQSEFLEQAESIKLAINYPLSRRDFYLRIAPLVTKLRDIHSHITLPKENMFFNNGLTSSDSAKNNLSPVAVLYEKTGLFAAADLSGRANIPTGAKILSINEIPIEFVLKKMKQLTAYETETGLRRKVQIEFPWLLSILGYSKTQYSVTYSWKGEIKNSLLAGLERPKENETSAEDTSSVENDSSETANTGLVLQSQSISSFYGHSQLSNDTALLWFNDFYEEPSIFEAYLAMHFKEFALNGTDNLIIDVRYNDGGLSKNIRTLLAYLTNQPISWSSHGEIKISEPLKQLHKKRTKQRRENKYSWGLHWLPLEWTDTLQYEISWSSIGEKIEVTFDAIQPVFKSLPGTVKVLTNGFCFSACATFVASVNRYELAETLGESAGSISQVQYVYPIKSRLKHTQIELSLPTMTVYFDSERADRRVILEQQDEYIQPNVSIERSLQQIIDKQDTALNDAMLR